MLSGCQVNVLHTIDLPCRPWNSIRFPSEVDQFSGVGQEPASRAEHVFRTRAAPLQPGGTDERDDVLSVLGVFYYDHVRACENPKIQEMLLVCNLPTEKKTAICFLSCTIYTSMSNSTAVWIDYCWW